MGKGIEVKTGGTAASMLGGIISAAVWLFLFLPMPADAASCPNEAFRVGPSAQLPDCRAYELVTPPDSNGRRVTAITSYSQPPDANAFPTELLSPGGNGIVFSSYSSPLLTPEGAAGVADVYEAVRSGGGWKTTRRISPPGALAGMSLLGGVASDHSYGFFDVPPGRDLAAGANLANPDGSYELIGLGSLGQEPFAQGRWISEGGAHVIFSTGRVSATQSANCVRATVACKVLQLEPDAAPSGTGAVYDRPADGPTHVVSLLPGDVPPAAGEQAFYEGASRDGTAVAFTIEDTLYVRVNNEETLPVAAGETSFAGLSDNGRHLFYLASGNIRRLDTVSDTDVEVSSTGDALISNVSADGSHVYFISRSQIAGAGDAGQPNMYVWSGSVPEYIGTVAESDLVRTSGKPEFLTSALGNWVDRVLNPAISEAGGPAVEAARTTPDGDVYVFESRARLTAADNGGHVAVYRFDDRDDTLLCISCPAAGPATADAGLQEPSFTGGQTLIRNVSDDGSSVVFETKEPLVERDTGGTNDVYRWRDGGLGELGLVSSGRSHEYRTPHEISLAVVPNPNTLLSVSRDGGDILFLALEALVPGAPDGGAAAIYDARVNGGFPAPPEPTRCGEEACRPGAVAVGALPAGVASEGVRGKGNVKPRQRRRCHRAGRTGKRKTCERRHKGRARGSMHRGKTRGSVSETASEGWVAPDPGAGDLTASGTGSAPPSPADSSASSAAATLEQAFAFEEVGAWMSSTVAGAHADFTTTLSLSHTIDELTNRPRSKYRTEEVSVSLPPGLLGNPMAVPRCKTGHLVAYGNCPVASQVGVAAVTAVLAGGVFPVFNLEPPHPRDEIARFGFSVANYPVFVDIDVRSASDFGATATVRSAPGLTELLEAETTIWGNPSDPSHDRLRLTTLEAGQCELGFACEAPGGERPSPIGPVVFMTNPSACQENRADFAAKSYQLPGQVAAASAPMAPTTDCTGLPFEPVFTVEPTTKVAGAPTGLHTRLVLPQSSDPAQRATATMREARVTLPPGMQIAAGAANWIGTCSDQQIGYREEVDAACPDASKLGTAKITSPSLPEPIEGALYQRDPAPGRPFGLWLAADAFGLHVKLPAELRPDRDTGRLTAVFADLPQVPVEAIELDVWGGERAPLQNPDRCGTYTTDYSFAPHSEDPPVTGGSSFAIDQGCSAPFSPGLHAGVTDPVAGRFSPFVFDLTRADGDQALRGFTLHLPDGELAKLAGVPLCGEQAAAAGTCPAGSRIGHLTAVSGPGPDPLRLPQSGKAEPQIFLAGPYRGSPFSVVSEVPAQAGPFDLGVVVVRTGLGIDPATGRAYVKADPLPQFFEGVGIAYRRLHAVIDRPGFSLNPTDCREMAIEAEVVSTQGAVAHPAARFQVDGCKALRFKPRLMLKLRGGTRRGDYPALTAKLRARKGDANIGRVSVALPRSEFLAQEHIGTICTRKQWVAESCPKASVYGTAKATTPLLDKPLAGKVYLRSSDHTLPDLAIALRGQVAIDLLGRIDGHKGGIRTTFASVPDAPITSFTLKMKGGTKGLLVNSTDICRGRHRAQVVMRGQNGRRLSLRTALLNGCGG